MILNNKKLAPMVRELPWAHNAVILQGDEQNLEHVGKHGIRDHEAEEAILFGNPIFQKSRKSTYVAFGVTQDGRYLFGLILCTQYGTLTVR